jgi:hypothetical protein
MPATSYVAVDRDYVGGIVKILDGMAETAKVLKGRGGSDGDTTYPHTINVNIGQEGFSPGTQIKSTIESAGKDVAKRIDAFEKLLRDFEGGLQDFLAASGNVESLNEIAAAKLREYLPEDLATHNSMTVNDIVNSLTGK